MKIYIVNGFPGSGKTSFEEYVQKICGEQYCYIMSTIDFVKEVADFCGWKGTKELKDRKFLSELKRIMTEWDDIPVKKIKKELSGIRSDIIEYGLDEECFCVFIDCREPEEIKRLCNELGAKSLLIQRESEKNKEQSNTSDSNVLNYKYDIIVNNNSDLKNLASAAMDFIEKENLHRSDKNIEIDFFGNIRFV